MAKKQQFYQKKMEMVLKGKDRKKGLKSRFAEKSLITQMYMNHLTRLKCLLINSE